MKIEQNSYVTIDYLIRLGEGETFPPDGHPEEISFCMGWQTMPQGLENALLGLAVNDHRVVRLDAAQAYGEVDQELIMEVARSDFAPEVELRPGLVFETENEEGHAVHFLVREVRGDTVLVDFNHPLAGQELEVEFTVKGVREATPEELHAPTCQCGGEHHHH
jgi:FKBP-type peptidyl-prolyl cis-trans isomerase SlyD